MGIHELEKSGIGGLFSVNTLDNINVVGVSKDEWIPKLEKVSGFTGTDSDLLKAIAKFESAHSERIDIRSEEFRAALGMELGGQNNNVVVSMRQCMNKAPAHFVAVACEMFLSATNGMLLTKTSADVGLQLVVTGVEKFLVRDMISTMADNLGLRNQDILRVLAAYDLYIDK